MPTLTTALLQAAPVIVLPVGIPVLAVAGGVLAVVDAGFRFRKAGGGAALAVLELVLGLLLVVAAFPPVQQFVSTTIPVLYLAVRARGRARRAAAREGGRARAASSG